MNFAMWHRQIKTSIHIYKIVLIKINKEFIIYEIINVTEADLKIS